MRQLSDGMRIALQARHTQVITMAFLEFDAEPQRVHNSAGDIIWDGYVWGGLSSLGAVSPIVEDGVLRPGRFTMSLNILREEWLGNARAERVQGRPVTVWKACRDLSDGSLLGEPYLVTKGVMDYMGGNIGRGESALALIIEDARALLQRSANVYWSNQSQQDRHPGDLACSVMDKLEGQRLDWGPGGGRVQHGAAYDLGNFRGPFV